ncbi:MAG: hypothetical protein AB4372_01525 [Xenococcus sp. (in: cyanobacteria)]
MTTHAEAFLSEFENENEILNAGTALFLAPVAVGKKEPSLATLTVGTALTGGEESVELSSDIEVILRKDTVLTFGSDEVVVAANTTVTTSSTTVPIEAAPAAIAGGATATSWGLLKLLSPTNIPINIEAQDVDRTDLNNGLQGSMVKVKIEMNNQITAIGRKDDQALYDYAFGASTSTASLYALIASTDGVHAFGRVQVSGWTKDSNINEIARPQFTIKFQAPWAAAKPYKWLTTALQTELNLVRTKAGLSALTE